MIRVRIKASSAIVKAGLESLLRGNSALRLAGDPSSRAGETRSAAESPPDVLLVEAETLAENSVREAMDRALAGGPVVVLVRNPALEPVADALRAGVKAVLPSGLTGPEMIAAIEAAAAGLVVMHGSDVESLLPAASRLPSVGSETLVEELTPREMEVLRLLAGGLGNKEIASRLEISEHTVKFHVASIMGKLGAASRTEAVTLGIRHGLILI
jgi:two-component system, NarL family, response regulator YdfI